MFEILFFVGGSPLRIPCPWPSPFVGDAALGVASPLALFPAWRVTLATL